MRIASCVILAGLSVLPALALTQVGDVLVATADLGADTGSIEIEERLVSRHEMRTSRRLIVVGASGEAAVRNLTDDPVSAGGPTLQLDSAGAPLAPATSPSYPQPAPPPSYLQPAPPPSYPQPAPSLFRLPYSQQDPYKNSAGHVGELL